VGETWGEGRESGAEEEMGGAAAAVVVGAGATGTTAGAAPCGECTAEEEAEVVCVSVSVLDRTGEEWTE
jgi:hypothetical protein